MPRPNNFTVASLPDFVGHDFGQSEPIVIDQDRINKFAEATEDFQWIHLDAERCKAESPFGDTIAHGFLTLSLLSAAQNKLGLFPDDARQIVNYGVEGVRFLAPVPVGSKVSVRTKVLSVEPKGDSRFVVRTSNEVLVEGSDKPALVAESIAYVMG